MVYTFVTTPGMDRLISEQIFPGVPTKVDTELAMFEYLLPKIVSGQKNVTVRYGKDKIRVPARYELPLFLTQAEDPSFKRSHGTIFIPEVTVKQFGELTLEDAHNDGYEKLDQLVNAVRKIYETIHKAQVLDTDWVSIYALRLPGPSYTIEHSAR